MTIRITWARFLLAAILVWSVSSASHGQDPASDQTPQSAAAVPADASPQLPTVAELNTRRQAAVQDANLDPVVRTQLEAHFVQAIEHLQAAEQANQQATALRQELEGAPQRVSDLEAQLASRTAAKELPAETTIETADIETLSANKQQADNAAATLASQLQQVAAEIERRAARRPQLAELRTQTEKQLEDLPSQLIAPAPEGERPEVTAIRLIRLRCRQHRLNSELGLLEQESRTYEGTARLWTLQQDLVALELREAEQAVQQWQQRLADSRRMQAEREAADAQRALAMSHESVRSEAAKNSALAEENTTLTAFLHTTQVDLDQVSASLNERQEEFKSLQKRAKAADFSPAVGVLLRNRHSTLPDRQKIQLRIEAHRDDISSLNLQLIEWQAERKTIVDLPAATQAIMDTLKTAPTTISVDELRAQVEALLEARLKLYGQLVENGRSKLDLLVRLDSEEKQLLASVDHEAKWLAEKVLWVRSTGVIGTQLSLLTDSIKILTTPGRWHNVLLTVASDFKGNPWLWIAFVLIASCLPLARFRLKRRISELGTIAERATCVTFLPTAKTLLYTVLIAVPFPLLIWCVGWHLALIAKGEDTLQALGIALKLVAGAWAMVAMIRQVARLHGLGDAHFEWSERSLSTVRRTMRMLEFTLLPTLAAVAFTSLLGDDEITAALGRIAFLGTVASLGAALFRLVWPSSSIMQNLEQQHADSWLWRTRWIWRSLLLACPLALAGLSILGYHYTAVQLAGRVAATMFCVLTLLLITSLLSRWLLVTYRNLAIRRGRERRQQMLQAAQADPDQPTPQDTTPELRLADINVQARRLLHLAGGVSLLVALYAIWIDVLPALGVLGRISVGWDNGIAGLSADGLPQPVTLADLLLAVAIATLTMFASRNLPGLMEIVVLQRLPMDAGARYAASTVSRYLIVVTGIILGFCAVGIGWSSVQWLVAAMTVGLGFGLQEIFANFVSGIILLFERPIRVGDTVTIGDITGTVTRIQIRATTIVDWDNKELIVPNREFVTGNLVNWTLTNPTLRLIINVGIAYGSDTRLATRLLYEVAQTNSQVLDDPEPVVVFSEFGDSTLNFDLRLFVNGLMNYRRLKHDLNIAIDDLFREHKIEIAFPQRDLHVRSLPSEQLRQALKP